MAQREIIQRVDDIDGSPAEHTVTFSLDGVHYEIDLSATNYHGLRTVLRPYVDRARRRTTHSTTAEPRSRTVSQQASSVPRNAHREATADITAAMNKAKAAAAQSHESATSPETVEHETESAVMLAQPAASEAEEAPQDAVAPPVLFSH